MLKVAVGIEIDDVGYPQDGSAHAVCGRTDRVPGAGAIGARCQCVDRPVVDVVIAILVCAIPIECIAVTVSGTQYERCSDGRGYQVVFEGSQVAYFRIADRR